MPSGGISLFDWSTTAANNASGADSVNWAEGQAPSTVNNSARQVMADVRSWYEAAEWIDYGYSISYVSGTIFKYHDANRTGIATVNRRVRAGVGAGTIYGTISDVTFSTSDTQITVAWDSGNLDSSLSYVALGILAASSGSLPGDIVRNSLTATLVNKTLTSPTITGTPTATGATWGDLGSVTTIDINGGTINGITDLDVADGGTGRSSHTAYAVLCGGTTSTAAQQSIAGVGSSGQVLTSNGAGALPTFQDSVVVGDSTFPSGTRMLFQQTAAPTYWTKDTTATYNDAALRIVTGTVTTGGADAFSTHFGTSKTTDSYTLLSADIPAHTHTGPSHTHTFTSGTESADHTHSGTTSGESGHTHSNTTVDNPGLGGTNGYSANGNVVSSGAYSGASSGHTHTFTSGGRSAAHTHSGTTAADGTGATGSTGGGGGHAHDLSNFNIKYADCIIATKD